MKRKHRFFILDDQGEAVEVLDHGLWDRWFNVHMTDTDGLEIAGARVNGKTVSCRFQAIDCPSGDDPPKVFEVTANHFRGWDGVFKRSRHTTRAEAIAAFDALVAELEELEEQT